MFHSKQCFFHGCSIKVFLSRAKVYSSNSTEFESVRFDLIWLQSNVKWIHWKDSEMFHHLNMGQNTEPRTGRHVAVMPTISPPFCRETSFHFEYLFIIFVLCVWMVCLHLYMCTACAPYACGGQKKVPDPLELIFKNCYMLPYGYWEPN